MHVLTCAPTRGQTSTLHIGVDAADLAAEPDRPGAFVLADRRVLELFPRLPAARADCLALPGGEAVKTMATLEQVLRRMAQLGLDRKARLIALGGGSIGDLGGLAASLYKRGIELIHVPTTLLAMLDSSVGGKTAVNLPEGKNLVGHVWPASRVLIDPRFLATLPEAEFASGLGEALKMAIGLDAELFALLEAQRDRVAARDPKTLERIILHAVRAKIRVVESDPREQGPRRLLNLGHTLGHALEMHAQDGLPHGLAVARGLHFAVDVAERLDTLQPAAAARCRALLRAYGFEPTPLPPADVLVPFLARDKKVEGDLLHFVLPTAIGACRTVALPLSELAAHLGRPDGHR